VVIVVVAAAILYGGTEHGGGPGGSEYDIGQVAVIVGPALAAMTVLSSEKRLQENQCLITS
jgi:hypothetical protein